MKTGDTVYVAYDLKIYKVLVIYANDEKIVVGTSEEIPYDYFYPIFNVEDYGETWFKSLEDAEEKLNVKLVKVDNHYEIK